MSAGPDTGGAKTLPELLSRNARSMGAKVAYREKEFGIWQTWTWAEAAKNVEDLAKGLLTLGVDAGDLVAVVGRNRPALYWAMIATQKVGAIPVPLYQDAAAEEIAYALENSGARFALVADQEQVDKISEVRDQLPNLEHVVYLDGRGLRKYASDGLSSYAEVMAQGAGAQNGAELQARQDALTYDSTCVMLYTSGTTSRPKGVVLSNRNVIETAKNSSAFDSLKADEEILAYLPMAWVGDFIFSMGQALWTGFCVNCPESAETMQADMREIGPTYFFAPPQVFERQLTQVMIRMEDASKMKKRMFHYFMGVAKRVGPDLLDGKSVG
ncbi:MAG: AMP-binding protein, partial [Octadecabacter sp.]